MAEQWRTVACVLVIAGGVTVVAGVVLRRLLPTHASPRYVLAVAFAAGLTLGYVLLPSWANLVPQRHWQWIPYVGAIAALVGGLSQARQLASLERVLLCGLLSLVSALVLVPTWDSLLPNRSVWCLGFMAYALGLMLLTQEWVTAATTSITVAAMLLATAAVAILTAAFVSLTYGQLGGVATAAVAGCWIVAYRQDEPVMVRGWLPAGCLVLVGCAFIGCIELEKPLYGILLVPLAPLAALITDGLMTRESTNRRRWIVAMVAAVVCILAAAVWVYLATRGTSEW